MQSAILDNHKHISYEDLGSGKPVIFIHPPGMGRHVFYHQRKLSEKMRVILPDLSGHGDSSRINVNDVSVRYYSEELIEFLDNLKIEKAVFCGYSAGGAIAQYISSHHPERLNGIILFGGYPAVLNLTLRLEHKIGMYMVKNHRSMLTKMLAISHTKNQGYQQLLISHMNKAQGGAWYKYYHEVLNINLRNDIKRIDIPLLLMYGTKSDSINQYHSFFKARTSQHRIVFIKHSSHQIPTKRWNVANEEISQFILRLD